MHLERFGKLSNIVHCKRFVNLDHAPYFFVSRQEGGRGLRFRSQSQILNPREQ